MRVKESGVIAVPTEASSLAGKGMRHHRFYTLVLALAWIAAIGLSLWWTLHVQQETTREAVLNQARAGIDRDLLFRRWNALHGGVYVPTGENTPPNPHLNVPEREITTPSGRKLTLVNPAYMARQVHALAEELNGTIAHLTSLKPLRPENAADSWEATALAMFERGATEHCSIDVLRGEPHLRVMRPLHVEQGCLKCHGQQGYRVGDVRGGLSVAVPLAPYLAMEHHARNHILCWHGLVLAVGLAGIGAFHSYMVRQTRQLALYEARVRQTDEHVLNVFHTSQDAVLLMDNERFIDCNLAAAQVLGYDSRDGLLLAKPAAISPRQQPDGRDSREKAREMMRIAFEKSFHRFEWMHRKANGDDIPIEVTLTSISLGGKNVLHCHWRDLTEYKQAETLLRYNEEKFRTIADATPDAVIMTDPAGNATYWNPSAQRIFGYTPEEVLGRPAAETLLPVRYHNVARIIGAQIAGSDQATTTGNARQLFALRKDGTEFPIEMNIGAIQRNDGRWAVALVRDITERRRSEEERERSRQAMTKILESMPVGVMVIGRDKKLRHVNPAALALMGYESSAEIIGHECHQALCPAQRGRCPVLDLGKSVENAERVLITKDRKEIPVLKTVIPVTIDGEDVLLETFVDISERKRVEQSLKAAKEEADAANRAKSNFLASMSHELRTPLTGILGFADLMIDGATDEQRRQEYLRTIRDSGKHLLDLINDILDLSKIEANRFTVERAACPPHVVLNEVVSIMRAEAQSKGLNLRCRWASPVPSVVETDGARLRQILLNLIGNAIKFTQHGMIEVVARVAPSANRHNLLIDVTDTGIGIAEDKLQCIFEPFVQADSSVTRRFGGTGLGLTICSRMARMLGGDITVKSQLGVGSTFTVCLDAGDLREVAMIESPPADSVSAGKSLPRAGNTVQFSDCRVLLVEDGETNRKFITTILERTGVQISTAENGEVGVAMATRNHFDLILMDMQMPVLDGYAATRKLRNLGYTMPIVALTAHAMAGDKQKCLDAGCTHYVSKPIEIASLMAVLTEALGRDGHSEGTSSAAESTSTDGESLVSSLPMEERVFRDIAREFLAWLKRLLTEMRQAAAEKDVERLAQMAHTLKGSAGTAGFRVMTEPARHLEELARQRRLEDIGPALDTIANLVKRIVIPAEPSGAAT